MDMKVDEDGDVRIFDQLESWLWHQLNGLCTQFMAKVYKGEMVMNHSILGGPLFSDQPSS